jgi:hypothetical protein
MLAKRVRREELSLCKISRAHDGVTMYLVSASGERLRWQLGQYRTEHVLFTGDNSRHFGNKARSVCTARFRRAAGSCTFAQRRVTFEKSEPCVVYATPTEYEGMYGTNSAMDCLVVHSFQTRCDCGRCSSMPEVFAQIGQLAEASGVAMHRHCEIQCDWMNTVVRTLKGCDHVVGILPACRVYYVATQRGPGGLLHAFVLLHPQDTEHTEHGVSITATSVVHEVVDAYSGALGPDTVRHPSSAGLLESLLSTLERVCDVVVVYDEQLPGLVRPLLVDLRRLYDQLPANTTGVASGVKLQVDMSNRAVASALGQWSAHDLHGAQFVLDGALVAAADVRTACTLCALDTVRGLVALCLETQRWSCIPVCHNGKPNGRPGPGRPTAMRNSLVHATTTGVLMPNDRPLASVRLSAPCKYRDPTVAVVMGLVVQLDFRCFYSSLVVEQNISAEVGTGQHEGVFVALTKRLIKVREDAKLQISLLEADKTRTEADRSRRIAKHNLLQRVAKDRMNATVGVWACTNAGCMADLPAAARVYECAKQCLASVLSLLQAEFATCSVCGCTHNFGPDGTHTPSECDVAVRGEPIRPLETVTDSVVFALSCGDTERTATEIAEYIQFTCFGHRSPICILLERVCSIWMYPNPSSCFALPLRDADACRPDAWLNKGPLLNPAKQRIDMLRLTRALFAAIACMHLQNFPKTARVAKEMATLAIERLRLPLREFRDLMKLTTRVCPPDMQQVLSRLYEPLCRAE